MSPCSVGVQRLFPRSPFTCPRFRQIFPAPVPTKHQTGPQPRAHWMRKSSAPLSLEPTICSVDLAGSYKVAYFHQCGQRKIYRFVTEKKLAMPDEGFPIRVQAIHPQDGEGNFCCSGAALEGAIATRSEIRSDFLRFIKAGRSNQNPWRRDLRDTRVCVIGLRAPADSELFHG